MSKTPVKVPEETAALLNVDFPDDESDQEYDPMKDPEALVKFCSEYLKSQPLPLQASYQPSRLGTERQWRLSISAFCARGPGSIPSASVI